MLRAHETSRARHRALLAGTLVAALISAVPAHAAITAIPEFSEADVSGTANTLTLERAGIVIGRATLPLTGTVKVNGGDACWAGYTPQILPNDILRAGGDSMTVQPLSVDSIAPDGLGGTVVTGTAPTAGAGELAVEGQAVDVSSSPWQVTVPSLLGSARAILTKTDGVTVDNSGGGDPNHAGCPAFHADAASVVDGGHLVGGLPTINQANVGSPLIVSGPGSASAPSLGGLAGSPAGAPGAGTWSASFATAGLPDGELAATPGPGGAPLTVLKDTTAPAAPTSSPPAGRYVTAPTVTLAAEPGSRIHFTIDGSPPSASSPVYTAPIRITNAVTIRAMAEDGVGNTGPVSTLAYQLGAASGGSGGSATPSGSSEPGGGSAAGGQAGRVNARISTLKVSTRQSLRRLRRDGLGVGVQLAHGTTAVRFMVYRRTKRGKRTVLKLVASLVRTPGSGRYRARLNARAVGLTRTGVYRLKVVPGTTRTTLDLSAARTIFLRVVR